MVSSIITQTENLLYEDGVIQIVSGKKKTTTSCPCNNSTSSTQNLTGYATQSWVQSQGYLTQNTLGNNVQEKVENLNFETDEENRQVISGEYLLRLETRESGEIEIGDQLSVDTEDGIVAVTGSLELNGNAVATQSWVQSQDYLKKNDEQIRIVSGEGDVIIGNQDMTGDGFQGLSLNEGVFDLYGGTVNVKSDYFQFNGDDVATQEWVDAQGYATLDDIPSLTGYATESWVQNQGYLTEHQDLSNYALKSEIPSIGGGVTQEWIEEQGYLTEHQSLADYALKSEIPSLTGYVTSTSLANTLTDFATRDWVDEEVERTLSDGGYATEQWVTDQGYTSNTGTVTSVAVKMNGTTKGTITSSGTIDLGTVLTSHQDISGKMDKSAVWTGTEAQWNALSDTQKASYTIALIKE